MLIGLQSIMRYTSYMENRIKNGEDFFELERE